MHWLAKYLAKRVAFSKSVFATFSSARRSGMARCGVEIFANCFASVHRRWLPSVAEAISLHVYSEDKLISLHETRKCKNFAIDRRWMLVLPVLLCVDQHSERSAPLPPPSAAFTPLAGFAEPPSSARSAPPPSPRKSWLTSAEHSSSQICRPTRPNRPCPQPSIRPTIAAIACP